MLKEAGGLFNIQISDGEPSLRDDASEIIKLGKEKGFPFFQLNTNGIRLAYDMEYVKRLNDAGLDCVFLQFDSLKDKVYEKLRGKALFEIKQKAIENCAECGLSVVLVPTLVAELNTNEIGDILNFAIERMPYIRGVHFQPVSFFGRYPELSKGRFTLPELLRAIEEQTAGKMKVSDFKPGTAENPYCSFNGSFISYPDKTLEALHKTQSCCCSYSRESEKARQYVAKKWKGNFKKAKFASINQIPVTMDDFIEHAGQYTLAVSAMVFQDAWNLDLDRLRDCYIHVVSSNKKIIPFCAYNLTGIGGNALYRR